MRSDISLADMLGLDFSFRSPLTYPLLFGAVSVVVWAFRQEWRRSHAD